MRRYEGQTPCQAIKNMLTEGHKEEVQSKVPARKINRRKILPKPFLKWVGGKRQLLPELSKHYPVEFGRYFEPFVGGGAVFFDLKPKSACLSDSNRELINCYKVVRTRVDELIDALQKYVYDRDYYYDVRAWNPEQLDQVTRAARTIYLNRTGYNGLYRVNSKGQFNVPFGRYVNPQICHKENLRACSTCLKGAKLFSAPFQHVLQAAKKDDFIYFDPPYVPLSETAYFTEYDRGGFSLDDQEELAQTFEALDKRGARVMLSNSDVPWIHKRYKKFSIRVVKAIRMVNSNSQKRGPVGEVLITNYSRV